MPIITLIFIEPKICCKYIHFISVFIQAYIHILFLVHALVLVYTTIWHHNGETEDQIWSDPTLLLRSLLTHAQR